MSSEPAAPLSPDAVVAAALPATAPVSAAPPPEAARALTVQERRLQVARDINAKIDSLEADIAHLSGAFGASRDHLSTTLDGLQQRTQATMAELLRVSTRLEEQAAHDDSRQRALDERLTRGVSELGQELGSMEAVLRQQVARLGELQGRHEQLARLHEHLEKLGANQARQLETLSSDTLRHLHLLRTHIDGLGALYREQRQALDTLGADHTLLSRQAAATEEKLAGLANEVSRNEGQGRRRFHGLAAGLATLAITSLGLIAWFQFYPSAVPETVRSDLASLNAGLGQQTDRSHALNAALLEGQEATARQMNAQDSALRRQGREVARLKAEAARTGARLRRIEARLAAPRDGKLPTAAQIAPLPGDSAGVAP